MYEITQHKEIISKYLEEEVRKERVWRVEQATEGVQCSPFKSNSEEGKARKVETDCEPICSRGPQRE